MNWNEPSWNSHWNEPQADVASPITNAQPTNPWDTKSEDECLLHWDKIKRDLAALKETELEFRKYIVSRAFPAKQEGINNKDLGNGYTLKAGVKFNYKLADNDLVEACLDKIATIGNEGQFVAERLVSWTPNFLITEYRQLQEQAEKQSPTAIAILAEVQKMLTIAEAAPTLEIKEPKAKK